MRVPICQTSETEDSCLSPLTPSPPEKKKYGLILVSSLPPSLTFVNFKGLLKKL